MATPIACPAPAALLHREPSRPVRQTRRLSSPCDAIPSVVVAATQRVPKPPSHAPAPRRPGSPHSSPKPAPAAYPPSGHDSVISTPSSPGQLYSQSASSSSNTSRDARDARDARHSLAQSLPLAADDDEKAALSLPVQPVVRASPPRSMVLDLEKQSYAPQSNNRRSVRNHLSASGAPDPYPPADADEVDLEDKAFKILLHLSGFACLVSFAISLWTLFAVVIAALLQPLRFCSMRPNYREQLVDFLSPSLRLQFRLIYSAPLSSMYNTPLLLIVCLLSPFVAIGVAIAAWISASFWIFAAIIGDPGPMDDHNDGREAVLTVRAYWESWLLRALR
ncbi:uncharacterized protein BKCO1_1400019 [Diplodia corticola]|uniref:Uncharacterized protein n=1 Tax=Diplodia corticola TaxID=236234 RepID=A0A1J9R5T1_9PEZI|nr:uncharacterized protein BKCO1_1400019 [Diplodia corticola]OJD35968.1 hypothetical protein BKCO1_1400019 [Diplodia corticola]